MNGARIVSYISCNELIYSDTNCRDRRSGKRKAVVQREEEKRWDIMK